jgi:hypothetical protein
MGSTEFDALFSILFLFVWLIIVIDLVRFTIYHGKEGYTWLESFRKALDDLFGPQY